MVIQPVILSGGAGTRLWPLSREHYPKQLLPLAGEQSLLQQTVTRLHGLAALLEQETGAGQIAAPLVVCNEEHRFLVAEQLRQIKKPAWSIILEPIGRNTAPALTLAALALQQFGEDRVMLVMPADHVIQDGPAFWAAVAQGALLAQGNRLVTFGIVPTTPHTGYGYIQVGNPLTGIPTISGAAEPRQLNRFVEKPNEATATSYLAQGGYLWNSGIFMMRASLWWREISQREPAMAQACQQAWDQGHQDGDFRRVDSGVFTACPSNSIDYAVMERVTGTGGDDGETAAAVIPLAAGWSDVGAWPALWEISPQDNQGNVLRGDVMTHATQDSMVVAEQRLVATVGLRDVIVVETADAVLVADKSHAQDVKEIVSQLKAQGRCERLSHRRVHRPWGSYESVDVGERFQVKRIVVQPGASLSLQMHHHRAEHWIVVKGTARVTRGEEVTLVTENQSTYIPLGVAHRLENPGKMPLEIIEVQSGSYLGEDDIVRFEDKYGR